MQKIIGQDILITEVNRVFEIFKASNCAIRPHFILTGPSASGKSLIIRSLTENLKLGFIDVNAAQLTKEGTSGNSLSKALSPLIQMGNKPTVVFVDEFDKMFISGNSNDSHAHETTTGVQNEFLKVLESNVASVYGDYGKYMNVNAANTLFVFAGAFNGEPNIGLDRLRELGLKTEFLGRVGLTYAISKLTLDNLYEVLDTSELLESYLKLFPSVDRETCVFAIKAYLRDNYEMNTLGARLVNTLINRYFIKGGKLTSEEVKDMSFQSTLSFRDN